MTKYRLKKDLPILKTGAIFFEFHDDDGYKWLSNDDAGASYRVDNIDNFDEWFEEIKESGWWRPKLDEMYYFLNSAGTVMMDPWVNNELDVSRYSVGNCFKIKAAAERYLDYLKAIATVRQDEGVMTPEQAAKSYTGYYVCINESSQLRTDIWAFDDEVNRMPANMILFDTFEHAEASLDNHPGEWKIIANCDWSRE